MTFEAGFPRIVVTKGQTWRHGPFYGAIFWCRTARELVAPVAQWQRSRFVIDRLGVQVPSGAPIGSESPLSCLTNSGAAADEGASVLEGWVSG